MVTYNLERSRNNILNCLKPCHLIPLNRSYLSNAQARSDHDQHACRPCKSPRTCPLALFQGVRRRLVVVSASDADAGAQNRAGSAPASCPGERGKDGEGVEDGVAPKRVLGFSPERKFPSWHWTQSTKNKGG